MATVAGARVRCALGTLLLLGVAGCGEPEPVRRPPNVVVLLADDLGWNDVGYHGGFPRTPNLDRFVDESLELDRFYVTPVCVSTRAALLTGRYPHRNGLAYVGESRDTAREALSSRDPVLPEMLGAAGYSNRCLIGKWHLGHGPGQHPLDRGFTCFYGALGGMVDYFDRSSLSITRRGGLVRGDLDWHRNRRLKREPGYSTDLIAADAVRFLERSARGLFLLYVAFTAPHLPLQAPAADVARYGGDQAGHGSRGLVAGSREDNRAAFAAMVTALDRGIGEILAAVDRLGLRDATLVLFLSDNGAYGRRGAGDNRPLRGRKGTLWEGAIRVPAAIRWPGVIPGGKSDDLVSYLDLVPTLRAIAGARPSEEAAVDGIDLLGILTGDRDAPDRVLYYGPEAAVSRSWKLLDGELFDLRADPGETTDVAPRYPEVVASLRERLREIEESAPPPATRPLPGG